MAGICSGFVRLALAGAADDDFPEWMRDGFFRLARFWELVAAWLKAGLAA